MKFSGGIETQSGVFFSFFWRNRKKSINEQIDMSRKIGIPRDEILNDFMDLYRATNVF